jgi:hypothetical protein
MNKRNLTKIGARASARFNVGMPIDFQLAFGHRKLKRRESHAPFISLVADRREQPFQIPVKFFNPTITPVKVSVANQPPKS